MKKFWFDKKLELLTIPFYIFFVSCVFILTQGLLNIFLGNGKVGVTAMSPLLATTMAIIGAILCLFSTALYIYVNFFEKSFPSCIAIKNKQQLKGIYKYVRHPSYYIMFSITFGSVSCLLSLPLFILACTNHVLLYFYYMIEETQMKKISSDYASYLKISNRFLPNFLKFKVTQN